VKRSIRYGIEQGVLKDDPLRGMRKDRPLRRERLIDAAERKLIFDSVHDRAFREFLFALQESGTRPGEVRKRRVNTSTSIRAYGFSDNTKRCGQPGARA